MFGNSIIDRDEENDEIEENQEFNEETLLQFPDLSKKKEVPTNIYDNSTPQKIRLQISIYIIAISILSFIFLQLLPYYQTKMISYYAIIIGIALSFISYKEKKVVPPRGM